MGMSRKIIWLLAGFVGVLIIGFFSDRNIHQKAFPIIYRPVSDYISSPNVLPSDTEKTLRETLPVAHEIKGVPFQSQAPKANWDELHDEACEEASIIIVKTFLNNESITAEKMDEEILSLVDWQVKNWGGHYDLTVS